MTPRDALLADFYSRMTEEDKRTYALLKGQNEVRGALDGQRQDLQRIERQVGWWPEFANNVVSNITTDALGWLFLKLLRRL